MDASKSALKVARPMSPKPPPFFLQFFERAEGKPAANFHLTFGQRNLIFCLKLAKSTK